jgi:hypothetical protein
VFSCDSAADLSTWSDQGGDVVSSSLIRQLEAAKRKNEELSMTSTEAMAREELLKLQIEDLEAEIGTLLDTSGATAAYLKKKEDVVQMQCASWKVAMKMILKAWRATRKLVARQSAIIAGQTADVQLQDAVSGGYFSREEMEYICSIAGETLNREVYSDFLSNAAISESSHEGRHSPQHPEDGTSTSPVLSPMRGGNEDDNDSALWYVSSIDEDPGDGLS